MAACSNANRCFLDMNYIDWKLLRLAHPSINNERDNIDEATQFWATQSVYYNVKTDGELSATYGNYWQHMAAKTWTGTFPEGTKVAGYRCLDPNTSEFDNEEHSAECVCNDDGNCDWSRVMPVCSSHGLDHSGYSWVMPDSESASVGSLCVSANTGGVGVVTDDGCSITMASEVDHFYRIGVEKEVFNSQYPAFNNYYDDGNARVETEFHQFEANHESCNDAYEWVSTSQLTDDSPMVNAPRTYAQQYSGSSWTFPYSDYYNNNKHTSNRADGSQQRTGICRVTYEDGKVCYGLFYDGKCGDYEVSAGVANDSNDGESGNYTRRDADGYDNDRYTYEVLILSNNDDCDGPRDRDWSECSTSCGMGTSTNGEDTRTCMALCNASPSDQYCNQPMYPPLSHDNYNGKYNDVYASHPLRRSLLNSRPDLQFICTGGGFWAPDFITGDEYYVTAPGERCSFECDEVDRFNTLTDKTSFSCVNGKLDTVGSNNWQYGWWTFPTCEPEYCIFPSYGKWFNKKVGGKLAQIGLKCPEGAKDKGDHWIVPKGMTCNFDCGSDHVRMDTTIARSMYCKYPIRKDRLKDYGCEGEQCDDTYIQNGADKSLYSSNSIDWYLNHQTGFLLTEWFDNAKFNKCYKVIDEGCNKDDLGANNGEDIAGVVWDCPDGTGPDAKCKKSCSIAGEALAGSKSEKECECKGTCAVCNHLV